MSEVAKANPDVKGLLPTPKRMAALFRRISSSTDGKLSYQDFSKFLQATDLKPYLERTKKKTKLSRKHFENAKLRQIVGLIETRERDKRKPLTALSSRIMLKMSESKGLPMPSIDDC